jgi:diaminopimelate decarboxylase
MTAPELVSSYGSPLWLADVDRFEANLRAFWAVWSARWPKTRLAYSCKTNRLLPFLQAVARARASAEVACDAEYELAARGAAVDAQRIVVQGPAKPQSLLARAGHDGALVLADSLAELERAARLGVARIGLRVALDSFTGAWTRFGIPPQEIVAAANTAAALGLTVRALSTHLVSTDFDPRTGHIVVSWPREPAEHGRAARLLAGLAAELRASSHHIEELDLGGGFPEPAATEPHARAVTGALHEAGFAGGLLLEPGRAIVADAVDLAFTVVSVKSIGGGMRCLACDAGTNFLPGAAWSPIRMDAPGVDGPRMPTLVSGPLCLNVDVLHPSASLPALEPGATLVARAVGAYQQAASTQFGERRPPAAVREDGSWRLYCGAESLEMPTRERPICEEKFERHAA